MLFFWHHPWKHRLFGFTDLMLVMLTSSVGQVNQQEPWGLVDYLWSTTWCGSSNCFAGLGCPRKGWMFLLHSSLSYLIIMSIFKINTLFCSLFLNSKIKFWLFLIIWWWLLHIELSFNEHITFNKICSSYVLMLRITFCNCNIRQNLSLPIILLGVPPESFL